jgi:phosphoadenosine phosphosulfate reductase
VQTIATNLSPPPLPPGVPSEDDPPELLLLWAAEAFGPHVTVATSLGPQSLVLLDMLHSLGLELPAFFLDTSLLFAETYALRRRIEERYGVRIEAVRPREDLSSQAARHGSRLWQRDPDLCCAIRKVEPLRRHLATKAAWITGLRRDQSRARQSVAHIAWDPDNGLWKLNPLVRWTRAEVDTYLRERGVPTNELLTQGYRSVGCRPCTTPSSDSDERSGRWAGSTKTECGIHGRLQVLSQDTER